MIKTFDSAVSFLERYIPTPDKKHPGELGLKRMQYLMDLLGNPELKYPTIHVGGTSGKGSTSTIIASIIGTKYKVGLTTSPHLVRINERIKILKKNKEQITDNNIKDKDFIDLVNKIKPFVEEVKKNHLGTPSYFEIVAAMAFLYFREQEVDIAVIEVGMGGRFDASNVIKPVVAVLTNVGLDHTEILGDTVEKIAEEKVGIIKKHVKVVSGAKQTSVIQIIREKCKEVGGKLSLLNRDFRYKIKDTGEEGSVFDYEGISLLKNLRLKLLGEYQVENAALAIRAVEVLNNHITGPAARVSQALGSKSPRQAGLKAGEPRLGNPSLASPVIKEDGKKSGLINAFIPGRLEIIRKKPLVILDGAHNLDKVRALVSSIKRIFPKKKIISIIAIKNDKDVKEMLTQLLKISQKVIFTKFQLTADIGIISSYDPEELLEVARTIDKDKTMIIIGKAKEALGEAVKSAKPDDLILITGSLYLVGEIKKKITNFKL